MVTNADLSIDANQLETHAASLLREQDCPGISVAVVDSTETVFEAGYGNRQLEPVAPATPDTLYGIGSSTKPITATAVMTLVEAGEISVDDAVSSYVPYLDDAPGDPITIHELLSHTSGLPSDDTATLILMDEILGEEFNSPLDDWEAFRDYVNGAVDRRLLDQHRTMYYNAGYIILARLVETVTGMSFSEYMQSSVLNPLGMERSMFDVGVLKNDDRDTMTPYYEKDGTMHGVSLPNTPLFEAPGGLQAPVTELAMFLSAWIEGDIPLNPDLTATMTEPVGTYETFRDGTEIGYGYGWMTRPFGDDRLVGHGGGTGVSAGYLGFLEDREVGIALGCNAQPDTSPEDLAIELLAEATETALSEVLPKQAITNKEQRITGEYTSYGGFQEATVRRSDEFLKLKHNSPMGAESMRLTPTSTDPTDYTFRVAKRSGKEETVEFFPNDESVKMLIGRNLFERVEHRDD